MTAAEERFDALFRDNYLDVLAYALRRCATRPDAEDVVAETFAVAWRRIAELPEGQQARLWLFGTARLVRMNSQRAERRRRGLNERLRARQVSPSRRGAEAGLAERDHLARALASLGALEREVLQLHVWEQLSTEEIATALELRSATVRKRLQRARQRLAEALGDGPGTTPRTQSAFAQPTQEVAR